MRRSRCQRGEQGGEHKSPVSYLLPRALATGALRPARRGSREQQLNPTAAAAKPWAAMLARACALAHQSAATPSVRGGGGLGAGPHRWARSAEQRRRARSWAPPHRAPAPPPAPPPRSQEDAACYPRTGRRRAAPHFRGGALATDDAIAGAATASGVRLSPRVSALPAWQPALRLESAVR